MKTNFKFQWNTNRNSLDIQLKFQWNTNGNALEIQFEYNSNFNGLPVESIENPVEFSIKCQLKFIENPVKIQQKLMKIYFYPVEISMKKQLEISMT